jgi:parvulin-like peptidyl-prolyl isomerase
LIRARIVLYVLTATLPAAVGHAQAPLSPSPTNSSGSPTSTPAKSASPPTDRVILKVGDVQVTQAEFESRIGAIEPQGGPDKDKEGPNQKKRRRLGDDYASVLMLSQEAVASYLDASPEVSRQLAVSRMQILSDAEFASLMNKAQPKAEEISQYYNSHLSDYEEVQARRLFIWKKKPGSNSSHGLGTEAARARADAILQASAAGHDTTKLTEAFKNADSGLLDPKPLTFPRGELSPAVEKIVFASKEGVWSQTLDTPDSIMLVQLVKLDHQQIGQVTSLIEKQLQGQKMQALLDQMKKNAGLWMDEQYFGTAVAPVPSASQRSSNPQLKLQESTTGETKNEP